MLNQMPVPIDEWVNEDESKGKYRSCQDLILTVVVFEYFSSLNKARH